MKMIFRILPSALLLIVATHAVTYRLDISTMYGENADTDGGIYAALVGSNGRMVNLGMLDNMDKNDFEEGNLDTFEILSTVDVGDLGCVILSAASDDAWRVGSVRASSSSSATEILWFSNLSWEQDTTDDWISTDASEGQLAKIWCSSTVVNWE